MVHFRTFLSALSVAAAASAVPVKRTYDAAPAYAPPMADSMMDMSSSSMMMEEKPMTTSMMAEEAMSTSMMEEKMSTSMMSEPPMTTSMMMESKPMTEAAKATSAMTYGSGSMDKSGYNDCVSQCMAQFGGGSANMYSPPASNATMATMGSGGGNGATHTVIVAPSQGVLRYVPAFVNAQPGDTVMFKWGANNHTVTKGSALLPCNKTEDAPFATGLQNKDFTFMQVVNDTSPTWFYCANPGHCQKGMFGVINPPMAAGSNSSAGQWMPAHLSNSSSSSNSSMSASNSTMASMSSGNSSSSDISSYYSYTTQMTQNNAAASAWGQDLDMSAIPDWAKEEMAANIMYTRNMMVMNPDVVDSTGAVSISTDAPLMLPNDVAAVNNGVATTPDASATSATGAAAAPAASSAAAEQPAGAAAQPSNGAGALASSKVVMAATVVLASFFLL